MRHVINRLRSPAQTANNAGASSDRYYQIGQMTRQELESTFVRGQLPDLDDLVGWEFRGMNTPGWAKLAGIKKFMKGFYRPSSNPDEVYGYNCPVVQNRLTDPWIAKPDNERPKRFGFYHVQVVDPTARDNAYLHAVLLDYSRGKNHRLDPSNGLRDYLVQVDPGNRDLYLGKAYYAVAAARVGVSFFVLERHRRAPDDPTF